MLRVVLCPATHRQCECVRRIHSCSRLYLWDHMNFAWAQMSMNETRYEVLQQLVQITYWSSRTYCISHFDAQMQVHNLFTFVTVFAHLSMSLKPCAKQVCYCVPVYVHLTLKSRWVEESAKTSTALNVCLAVTATKFYNMRASYAREMMGFISWAQLYVISASSPCQCTPHKAPGIMVLVIA